MPDQILEWTKAIAVLGGVTVGIFAVFAPSWVWLKRQLFGWGGLVLVPFGTILIVASMFRTVSLLVDAPKLEFKLAALESELRQARTAIGQINTQIAAARTGSGTGFLALMQARDDDIKKLQAEVGTVSMKITGLTKDIGYTVNQLKTLQSTTNNLELAIKKYGGNAPLAPGIPFERAK
jgi:hypothetical protein